MPADHQTRVAVLRQHGADFEFEDHVLPEPIDAGAAIVRVTRTTLCGTDVELWDGRMGWDGMLPIVLGHETVGLVEAAAPGTVTGLGEPVRVGDRVIWSEASCGHCRACRVSNDPVKCEARGYGFLQHVDEPPFVIGGLSELVWVPPNAEILKVPDGLGDELAAATCCALRTMVHGFLRVPVRMGDHVVVQGSGSLGLFASVLARKAGAASVTVIGNPVSRLEVAARFGTDQVIGLDTAVDERRARVMDITQGHGADVLVDVAGVPGVVPEGLAFAASDARYLLIGATTSTAESFPLVDLIGREITLVGSVHGDFGDLVRAVEFLERTDDVPWELMFEAPLPLTHARLAIERLATGHAIKPTIDPRIA